MSTDLLQLAMQVEQASADKQRAMLVAAYEALWPDDGPQGPRGFFAKLDAGAYESAAMSLIPQGWIVDTLSQRDEDWPEGAGTWTALLKSAQIAPGNRAWASSRSQKARQGCATPALAFAAAILRAARQKKDTPTDGR